MIKQSMLGYVAIIFGLTLVHAEQPTKLSVLTTMAESELQEETGYVPDQLSSAQFKALQHRLERTERDFQNQQVNATPIQQREFIPMPAQPDMSQLPVFLQQYVTAIAQGLQSNDPTQGIYILLNSAGIDRHQANAPERGQLQIRFNDAHIQDLHIQNNLLKPAQRLN